MSRRPGLRPGTKNGKILRAAGTVLALFAVLSPTPLLAFNQNYLLSDFELTDGNALSRVGIQQFLQSKGSALANASFESVGGMKSAADIIYDAGRYYGISPKYLLVRLQVEQSLISDPTPIQRQYDWATGYAVCDSCSTDDPGVKPYKGFFNQVNWAARIIRNSYWPKLVSTGRVYSFGVGITTTTSDWNGTHEVTPANMATAALYTYTPHVYNGNYNLSNLWESWFARKFPDGAILIEVGTSNYFRIEGTLKRPYRSVGVLASYMDPRKALPATPNELGAYETGPVISFPNYTLIRSPRGTVFLIVDGVKRGITGDAFRTIGFNPEMVEQATWEDINAYPDGPIIDMGSSYPQGALLQSASNGGIIYVENGIRHPIYSPQILQSRFKGQRFILVTQAEIDGYALGAPILFADGELVTAKGDPSVYVISGGAKRPIASQQAFENLGFSWSNLVWTDARSLSIHVTGDPVE